MEGGRRRFHLIHAFIKRILLYLMLCKNYFLLESRPPVVLSFPCVLSPSDDFISISTYHVFMRATFQWIRFILSLLSVLYQVPYYEWRFLRFFILYAAVIILTWLIINCKLPFRSNASSICEVVLVVLDLNYLTLSRDSVGVIISLIFVVLTLSSGKTKRNVKLLGLKLSLFRIVLSINWQWQ